MRRRPTSRRRDLDPDGERLCVLIADPDRLAREMTSQALYASPRVGMVLGASDGRQARELACHYHPAVLALDTSLPCPNSLADVVADILDCTPQTRVLTMAAGDDQTAIDALRAGAVGHIGKHLAPTVVAREVMRAADGEAVIPRRLTMQLLHLLQHTPPTGWRPLHSRLTTREWEIIDLLKDGAGTQEIADTLVLSTTTVYSHIKNATRKLHVHTRREAIHAADQLRHQEALGTKLPATFA